MTTTNNFLNNSPAISVPNMFTWMPSAQSPPQPMQLSAPIHQTNLSNSINQTNLSNTINFVNNYQNISKDFIEKFAASSSSNIANTNYFYADDSRISLTIQRSTSNTLYELVGHPNLKSTLVNLGINSIKYFGINYACQPAGKKSVLITMFGKAEINGGHHDILCTFVIRISLGMHKIMNHIINISM